MFGSCQLAVWDDRTRVGGIINPLMYVESVVACRAITGSYPTRHDNNVNVVQDAQRKATPPAIFKPNVQC